MDIELYGLINSKLKGKASLVNGKVPADQLPSYVDDVINGYYHDGKFYEEDTYTTEIPAEEGKIYVDLATNTTYRWSGLAYIQIGGLEVLANPTLVGDEPELTGLQIGDAKYKVNDKFYVVYEGNIPNDMPSASKEKLKEINCLGFILKTSYGNRYYKKYSESSNEITFLQLTGTTAPLWCYATMNKNSNAITTSTTVLGLPSDVVANPTLAGTEAELTGLQIGDTKYKLDYLPISGGTMNGSITFNNSGGIKLNGVNTAIRDNLNNNLLRSASTVYIGTSQKPLDFITSDTNITHTKYGLIYNVLDSSNTKANPTLDGTEADLTGLQVDGTKYKVNQPINVEANPTLAGTEADLEGIQIGDTKYKVGGNSSVVLYEHSIMFIYGETANRYPWIRCYLQVLLPVDTPITTLNIADILGTTNTYHNVNGQVYGYLNPDTTVLSEACITGVRNYGSSTLYFYYNYLDSSLYRYMESREQISTTQAFIQDTVTPITLGNIPNGDNEGF